MKSIFTTAIVAATLSVSITSCIADEALNTECDILTCTLPEGVLMSSPTITNDRVTLMALPDADISKLAPEFTITEGATITPASGSLQDLMLKITLLCIPSPLKTEHGTRTIVWK